MSTLPFFWAAAACNLTCQGVYIWAMVKGEARPHLFTWLVWTITMGIAGVAQWASAGGIASFLLLAAALSCGGIALASLWCGHREHTRTDWVMLTLALATIPLWMVTKNPLGSVLLATLIDLSGYGPTIRKSWTHPREESLSSYALGGCGMLLSLGALDQRSFVTACYPVAIALANGLLVGLLVVRRRAT